MNPPMWFWVVVVLVFSTTYILLLSRAQVPSVPETVNPLMCNCNCNCSSPECPTTVCPKPKDCPKANCSNCTDFCLEEDKKQRKLSYDGDCAIPPHYIQKFPIEEFPGLKCYVMASSLRKLVITEGCETIYVRGDNITIDKYVIPRQLPGKRCNRCYVSDYLNSLAFILFGDPELGIEPLAPLGALIIEDDVLICRQVVPVLKECLKGQYNCVLGSGAMMNYYAGAYSEQPNPANYSKNRFTSKEDLFDPELIDKILHVDIYLLKYNKHAVFAPWANHMGAGFSVMGHKPGAWAKCLHNETFSSEIVVNRPRDVKIWIAEKNEAEN